MLRRVAKRTYRRIRPNRYRPLNRVELDKPRLLHNISVVQQRHPERGIIPVLKGNAYGHGLEQIAAMLNGAEVSLVAVDGYFEADRIRDHIRHRILVMGYILPDNVRLLDTRRCSFVVQDETGLTALASLHRHVRVHMEVNTGMNRMGLQPGEIDVYLALLKRHPMLELEGVMTHLADADNELDDTFTKKQVTAFDVAVGHVLAEGFRPRFIHVAQTAASTKAASKHANTVRLGIGLYGINPLSSRDARHAELAGLQPVLALKSTIIKVLELQKGDRVSYNGTFTAPRAMRVGVLPLGYYEGVPRELSNKGCVTHDALRLPVVGRVCMNHTMIDLTGTPLDVYDEVTVISNNSNDPNSVSGLQRSNDLFAYTTLTGISSSVARAIVTRIT